MKNTAYDKCRYACMLVLRIFLEDMQLLNQSMNIFSIYTAIINMHKQTIDKMKNLWMKTTRQKDESINEALVAEYELKINYTLKRLEWLFKLRAPNKMQKNNNSNLILFVLSTAAV